MAEGFRHVGQQKTQRNVQIIGAAALAARRRDEAEFRIEKFRFEHRSTLDKN